MKDKLQFALKQAARINSMNGLIRDIRLVTKAYTELIDSIYTGKSQIKEGEVFIETLSMKILLTTHTCLGILRGIQLETMTKRASVKQLDFASLHTLSRTMIEAFLTLEYLFYNTCTVEEKEFRFLIWRISGYKSRQTFVPEDGKELLQKETREKLIQETQEMDQLLVRAKKHPLFLKLTKQDAWKLDKFGIPRLKSWNELVNNSMLGAGKIATSYKHYSNYAHSEYISLIQMNGADVLKKGSEENNLHVINALRVILMINCVSIVQLRNKFACTRETFEKLSQNQQELILFWNMLGSP